MSNLLHRLCLPCAPRWGGHIMFPGQPIMKEVAQMAYDLNIQKLQMIPTAKKCPYKQGCDKPGVQ